MLLLIEPELMERTVFHAARAEVLLARRYHQEFSRCFNEVDGDRRDQAFRAMHETWFTELGFRPMLLSLIGEFQLVRAHVQRVVFSGQIRRRNDGAELFGKPGRYTIAATVTPALLQDRPAFLMWARHELQHIDDMLDPAFELDSSAPPSGTTAATTNRLRDRYAVIWSTSIDARLDARGRAHPQARQRRLEELIRSFGLPRNEHSLQGLHRLWARLQAERPTHGTILAWAENGLPDALGGGVEERFTANSRPGPPSPLGFDWEVPAGMGPGAPCPLCSFSTYDWVAGSALRPGVVQAIIADQPTWRPNQGCCGQCAEIYRGRTVGDGDSRAIRTSL